MRLLIGGREKRRTKIINEMIKKKLAYFGMFSLLPRYLPLERDDKFVPDRTKVCVVGMRHKIVYLWFCITLF